MIVKGYLLVFTGPPTGVFYRTYRHSNKNYDELFYYLEGFRNYIVDASYPVVLTLGICSGQTNQWVVSLVLHRIRVHSFAHRSRFCIPFQLLVTPDQTLRKRRLATTE